MGLFAEKKKENTAASARQTSLSSATDPVQNKSHGEQAFQFVDKRSETAAKIKLQEAAENCPKTMQLNAIQEMANDSPKAKQADRLKEIVNNRSVQQQPLQMKKNNTGLSDQLKTGMENLSGISLDDVKIHRNSDKPAQLQAHAYTQGSEIHLGPNQEKHLPHEAWHVVQQKQGRVKPTVQMQDGINMNDDAGLEKEADVMGSKALQLMNGKSTNPVSESPGGTGQVFQRIAWHEKANGTPNVQAAPNINGVNNAGKTTSINVAGYMFTGPMYELAETTGADNKVELITEIANAIGSINHPTNDLFLTKRQLETNIGIDHTVPFANVHTLAAGVRNIYRGALDPYILRAPGKTDDNEKVALHYQFGKDSYGYIVKIEQEGKLYTMHGGRGQDELIREQRQELGKGTEDRPLYDQFSSAHDTDSPEESISDVASQSTLDKQLTLYPASKKKDRERQGWKLTEKSKRLDAVAKIGGEGARWQCVREHALSGKLTNSSRFYTKNFHNGGNGYVGMTFQVLWGCWATVFNSDFNIDNQTVIDKLLELYDEDDPRILSMKDDEIKNNDYSLN